jgi:glyoxylase-like metal-dependent hydrolase (beta-lactamase superfamily II)
MLGFEGFGDVTRIVMSTAVSRSIGYSVSAYLTRGILIDLGFPAVWGEFAEFIDDARPVGAIITHHHEDHGGNAELAARRGLPLAASEATLALLRGGEPIDLHRRIIWGTPKRLTSPVQPLASDALHLIPTPGHASDHHVVWDAERETLFAGDLFLSVKVRAAHPGEDPRELARSVRTAAALRPKRMFDAHRGLVPDPVNALLAKADWLDETIATIERHVAEGWGDRAITRAVLGREDAAHYVSRGAMSKINLVRAVRGTAGGATANGVR